MKQEPESEKILFSIWKKLKDKVFLSDNETENELPKNDQDDFNMDNQSVDVNDFSTTPQLSRNTSVDLNNSINSVGNQKENTNTVNNNSDK